MASKEFENLMRSMTFSLVNHGDDLTTAEKMVLIQAIARGSINTEEKDLINYYNNYITRVQHRFEDYKAFNVSNDVSFTFFCDRIGDKLTSSKYWGVFRYFVVMFDRLPNIAEFIGFFVALYHHCPYLSEYFGLLDEDQQELTDIIKKSHADEIANLKKEHKNEMILMNNKINKITEEANKRISDLDNVCRNLYAKSKNAEAELEKSKFELTSYINTIGAPLRPRGGRTINEQSLIKEFGKDAINALWLFAYIKCDFTGNNDHFVLVDDFHNAYVKFCKSMNKSFVLNGDRFNKLVVNMFKMHDISITPNDNGDRLWGVQFKY